MEGRNLAFNDLREFLDVLERKGQLVRVKAEVEDGYEITAIMAELSRRQGPAVIFERVKGYDIPVLGNIFGNKERMALSVGLPESSSLKEIRNKIAEVLESKSKWIPPRIVDAGPCKEVIMKGDEADLTTLPVLKWNPGDGGPFITMADIVMSDPSMGRNLGMYRLQVRGKRETGILLSIMQDSGIYAARARAKGAKTFPIAAAIGLEPSLYIAGGSKIPPRDDEFALAGAFRGEPVELVKCETVDLEVPAHSEIVIEGEIILDERRADGPFAEWPGYYSQPLIEPIVRVTAITTRKNPIYQTCYTSLANSELEYMRFPVQCATYNALKRVVSGFRDYHAPFAARGFKGVVQIQKRFPGWGKQALLATLGMGQVVSAVNYVVVVDDDIDIWDMEQVEFAVATRVDPQKDVLIIPEMGTYAINPAARTRVESPETGYTEFAICSKMGIDATKKSALESPKPTPPKIELDPKAEKKVKQRWADYGIPPLEPKNP